MGNSANEFQELNELQLVVSFPLFLFVDDRHVTVSEAECDIFLGNAQLCVPSAKIDAILMIHELLCRRPVPIIDVLEVSKIGFKNVINIHRP